VFVLGILFQPIVMFASKAGAYLRVVHLEGASLGQVRLTRSLPREWSTVKGSFKIEDMGRGD
jgi:hypothetical protein